MSKAPSREPIDYASLLTFCVAKLNMRPADFWSLTFGEFWPMYNAIMGKTITPLSMDDLEDLEASWTGAS